MTDVEKYKKSIALLYQQLENEKKQHKECVLNLQEAKQKLNDFQNKSN